MEMKYHLRAESFGENTSIFQCRVHFSLQLVIKHLSQTAMIKNTQQKRKILVRIFNKSPNFDPKSQFWPKVPILTQCPNFDQMSQFYPKVQIEKQAMGLKCRLDECDRRIGASKASATGIGFCATMLSEIWFGDTAAPIFVTLLCFFYICYATFVLCPTRLNLWCVKALIR